jgi:hypothetical protein
MKDKELNLEEIETSHTLDGEREGRVQGRGGVKIFFLNSTSKTRKVVWSGGGEN